ncbi:LysR family transcriptional regulator [Paraburkholderia bryophila]|uniref:DNA-binding transcriptional LysR family regulator n=1 Tax=Paraburkholderia bryophila TaxID=420952 RepID=A0A7Y9WKN0_9BURK|nr:LysR family transcriptional regulator [Paraburkholderia bryophila]NYH22367.1 DNA-binding transcriptional LysR family regulator [Paraburkholderia bryophila]
MSVRRLNHVVALAEEGSFARAAERVHLSQPALSRSIQAIEDELGLRLFDRAARGVAVTQAGKTIVERARRVLFEANCLVRDAELLKTHEIGEVQSASVLIRPRSCCPICWWVSRGCIRTSG